MIDRVRDQRLQSLLLLTKFESSVPYPSGTEHNKNRGYPGSLVMRVAGFALSFHLNNFSFRGCPVESVELPRGGLV